MRETLFWYCLAGASLGAAMALGLVLRDLDEQRSRFLTSCELSFDPRQCALWANQGIRSLLP